MKNNNLVLCEFTQEQLWEYSLETTTNRNK